MKKTRPAADPGFGIRSVSRLTGISQPLLRTWETRYGVVTSTRGDNGRRLYSAADVKRLSLLQYLVSRGESIGQLATLDTEQLRQHGERLSDRPAEHSPRAGSAARPTALKVAVLGDFLPARLAALTGLPGAMKLVTSSASIATFSADIRRLQPDVLVIEMPMLDDTSKAFVTGLAVECPAARVVVVYGFTRKIDQAPLRARGIALLRAPCSLDTLFGILLGTFTTSAESPPTAGRTAQATASPAIPRPATIPPRRFGSAELARLANATSTIDCECPQHLVELVLGLSAFEAFSAACENRNEADAALHADLHGTTAHVRAIMEQALERVARAEGLLE